MNQPNKNLTWHAHQVTKKERGSVYNYKPLIIWFTGLSGSGKSTLAGELEYQLFKKGFKTYLLDGDNVRHGLNKDLGFSDEDRQENIRRIGEVAKLFVDSGTIVMTAFISPFKADRNSARALFEDHEFIEVFVKCSLEVCESRDTKGLYEKAKKGIIKEFTGISSPYEEPPKPEIVIETDKMTVSDCVGTIQNYLFEKGLNKNV